MMSTSSGYSSPKLCDRTSLLTPSSCHKMVHTKVSLCTGGEGICSLFTC